MGKIMYQTYPHFYERMMEFVKENQTINECDYCFVGDSLIEMFDLSLFGKKNYVNRGIISDKSFGVLHSIDDRVLAINPKGVFILVGTNDICDGYSKIETINILSEIIRLIKKKNNNTKIIISTLLPPCYYKASHVDPIYKDCRSIDKLKSVNEGIKELAKEKDIVLFDAFKVLADKHDSLRIEDTLDGVHITQDAYKKLVKEIEKIL